MRKEGRRVSERGKERARRGGELFQSLRGHRLRKKAAGMEKDEERAPRSSCCGGGQRMGREGNGRRGRKGGDACECAEKKRRGVEVTSLRVGSRPRTREGEFSKLKNILVDQNPEKGKQESKREKLSLARAYSRKKRYQHPTVPNKAAPRAPSLSLLLPARSFLVPPSLR